MGVSLFIGSGKDPDEGGYYHGRNKENGYNAYYFFIHIGILISSYDFVYYNTSVNCN